MGFYIDKNAPSPKRNFHLNCIQQILTTELCEYKGDPFIEEMEAWMINKIKPARQLLQIKIKVDKVTYKKYLETGKPIDDVIFEKVEGNVEIEIMGV